MIFSINVINEKYPMIGLSADWVYRTWLLSGTETKGIVLFEEEGTNEYSIIEYSFDETTEKRTEKVLISGLLETIIRSTCYIRIESSKIIGLDVNKEISVDPVSKGVIS